MDKAEFPSAKRLAKPGLKEDHVPAWQAHHKAQYNEFMTRLGLV